MEEAGSEEMESLVLAGRQLRQHQRGNVRG